MKVSKSDVRCKAPHTIPVLQFEEEALTSFSGLVVFQQFFSQIDLKGRLAGCFRHARLGKIFDRATVFLQLLVHLLLGFRELRHNKYYENDPLVKRILGLRSLPDVGTISRALKEVDQKSLENLRRLLREMVVKRLKSSMLVRITLDFDGSVQSTGRFAEGTAVGFNKKKKGARSYYPLFCTIAQTGQVFDFLHRPGNVHDSNGAQEFILACIQGVRDAIPWAVNIEVRVDSAFFSDEIVQLLDEQDVEFTISVPFERFLELKRMIEARKKWRHFNDHVSYFESSWKPQSWSQRYRFLFIRTRTKLQRKGPVQLDLFIPHDFGYEFKVIVTNKTVNVNSVVAFHEGRGTQESIFAELKTNCHMDYVPVRRLLGNQLYLLAGLFAYNLTRELQMATSQPSRQTTTRRATLWVFERLNTLRATLIQRAGRFTKPQGTVTLTINGNNWLKQRMLRMIARLQANS